MGGREAETDERTPPRYRVVTVCLGVSPGLVRLALACEDLSKKKEW